MYCRIGFLNLWTPTKVEGTLEMNLARRGALLRRC